MIKQQSHNNFTAYVTVVGGGWSGLACALKLIEQGLSVQLVESAKQLGGRARSVQFKRFLPTESVDNGQHIMLGAYHQTLELFSLIGLKESDIIQRSPLTLYLSSAKNKTIQLTTPFLPAPLHLIVALFTLQGISFRHRMRALRMTISLAIKQFKLPSDCSVQQLLEDYQQPQQLIDTLWQPLCLATLNTPIKYASAEVFLRVLKDSFSNKRSDSDILLFKDTLSQCFCQPASDYIINHKSSIYCCEKLTHIAYQENSEDLSSFILSTATAQYNSQYVVLATSAGANKKLLDSISNKEVNYLLPQSASLNFFYEPITTIYLYYPADYHSQLMQYFQHIKTTMVGLYGSLGHWVFDRSTCHQNGLIAVIISGPGKHLQLKPVQLAEHIHYEIKTLIPSIPLFQKQQVITEYKATFSCRVNVNQQRPQNKTKIDNLYLAGDYTDTGYPATIEGAIRSGLRAAQAIIKSHYQ